MFLSLLVVVFCISVLVSLVISQIFSSSIKKILKSILLQDDISELCKRYLNFVIYVIGISSGVRIWQLEKYLNPNKNGITIELTRNRWILEIYQTIIGSLQGLVWMLFLFFLAALVSCVVSRVCESKFKDR